MAVAASGVMSLPLENLRTLVANSSYFQTWVSAADAAAACAHIYRVATDPPLAAKRPFATVRHCEPAEFAFDAATGADSGAVELWFEAAIAAGNQDDHADAEFAFTNVISMILSDIVTLSHQGGYMVVREIECLDGPGRGSRDETESEGQYYVVLYKVHWGILPGA